MSFFLVIHYLLVPYYLAKFVDYSQHGSPRAHRTYSDINYLHCRIGVEGWICLREETGPGESVWVNLKYGIYGTLREMERELGFNKVGLFSLRLL